MLGWNSKAFFMSWNGKHVLAEKLMSFNMADDKGQVTEYEWRFHSFRNVMWAPDNKHMILWKGSTLAKEKNKPGGTAEGVAVLDADDLGAACTEAKHTLVYKKSNEREPFSAGWSPRGNDVYVASRIFGAANGKNHVQQGAVIEKVPVNGGPPIEVFRHTGKINGFWMPWTRYEDGSGPNERPFQILVSTNDGLYLVDEQSGAKDKISDLHPDDIVWCPGPGNTIALLYNNAPETTKDGKFQGVYLCNLEKREKGKPLPLEQLIESLDVDTIWFSPKGKYFVWQTQKETYYREPAGKPDSKVRVTLPGAEGVPFKGCIWNGREDRLAVVALNRVFVHDAATKSTTEVAKLGEDGKAFAADPQWRGDDLVIGSYINTGQLPPKK